MSSSVVYDSGCGPCTAFRRAVGFLDPEKSIRFLGISDAERSGLLSSVPHELRWRSFHVVSPTGEVRSGADALSAVAGLLPGGGLASRALASVPPVSRSVAFAYLALSRLHGRGSCRQR